MDAVAVVCVFILLLAWFVWADRERRDQFCRRCGRENGWQTFTQGYSPKTGEPYRYQVWLCPMADRYGFHRGPARPIGSDGE